MCTNFFPFLLFVTFCRSKPNIENAREYAPIIDFSPVHIVNCGDSAGHKKLNIRLGSKDPKCYDVY